MKGFQLHRSWLCVIGGIAEYNNTNANGWSSTIAVRYCKVCPRIRFPTASVLALDRAKLQATTIKPAVIDGSNATRLDSRDTLSIHSQPLTSQIKFHVSPKMMSPFKLFDEPLINAL